MLKSFIMLQDFSLIVCFFLFIPIFLYIQKLSLHTLVEFSHAYKPKSKHVQKYRGLTQFQKACEHKSNLR